MTCESFPLLNRCKNHKFSIRFSCVLFSPSFVASAFSLFVPFSRCFRIQYQSTNVKVSTNTLSWMKKKPQANTEKKEREQRMRFNWVLNFFCGWLESMNKKWDLKKKFEKICKNFAQKSICYSIDERFFFCFPSLFFGRPAPQFHPFIFLMRYLLFGSYSKDYYYYFLFQSHFFRTLFSLFTKACHCVVVCSLTTKTKRSGRICDNFSFS